MESTISLSKQREKLIEVYRHASIKELPTPNSIEAISPDLRFRPHVKTHKTAEIVRIQLDNGRKHKSVVASTISEIRGLGPLVQDGTVKDILYGIPPTKSKIPTLAEISQKLHALGTTLRLMIDSAVQLQFLKDYSERHPSYSLTWSVVIKINVGDNRAGQTLAASDLTEVIKQAVVSKNISLHGFYTHAGGSYSSTSIDSASEYLDQEISGVYEAAVLARSILDSRAGKRRFVLSVGATPTAHASAMAFDKLTNLFAKAMQDDELEIHAGNYAMLDMQQVATGLGVSPSNIAGRVVAEVITFYSDREEYLIDAGVLALAREPGRIPGIATIKGQRVSGERWIVGRVSQEHGIITKRTDNIGNVFEESLDEATITKSWTAGDRVVLLPQHSCITSSMYQWYYVVEDDKVVDIYLPWRGW
ncbi:putative serine dehydratase domain-containing protein [Lipomyces kononenkoae]|uniref:Serine dehydratase domain-containing protein n=1 Tax=Lipomyces kononenkoae TaxID=34357 RepID=A0ACC3STP6_LIPKO